MKNNNGFTLAELLGIIIVLALIVLVSAPSMTKQIKKKEVYNQTILDEKIYNATRMYAAKYYAEDIINKKSFSFTLDDLVSDGLINLKDKCSNVLSEEISYTDAGYNFEKIKNNDCASDKIGSKKQFS